MQDGLTSGFIYALLTLTILLVFLVTRVLWIPAGDFLVMGALSMAMLRQGVVPGTVWLALGLGGLAAGAELLRGGVTGRLRWRPAIGCLAPPAVVVPAIILLAPLRPPASVLILLVLALVAPMGFALYRLAFRPLAGRSVLILLFMAVAVHDALIGCGQIAFGSESFRTRPFLAGRLDVGVTRLSFSVPVDCRGVDDADAGAVVVSPEHTLWGRALRATAVNRVGARLVGVRTEAAGALAFVLAAGDRRVVGGADRTGDSVVLRFRIRPWGQRFHRHGDRGNGEFSAVVARGDVGRPGGDLGLVLRIGLQRGVGLRVANSVFALAIGDVAGRGCGAMTRYRGMIGCLVGVFAALPLVASQGLITSFTYIGIDCLVAIGLVLLTGMAGLTSFGQAAFTGVAAYATALLTTQHGWPALLALPVSLAFAGRDGARTGGDHGSTGWGITWCWARWPGARRFIT